MKMKYWFGISMVILGIVCVIVGRTKEVQVQVGQVWEDDFRTGNPFDGFTSTRRRILAVRDGYAQYEIIGDRYKTINVMRLSLIKTSAYLYEGVIESDMPDIIETAIDMSDITFDIDTTEPNWWSLTADSDLIITGSTTCGDMDPNIFIIGTWIQPVYNCPAHGEVVEVITFLDSRRACVDCFFDVFPPLESE